MIANLFFFCSGDGMKQNIKYCYERKKTCENTNILAFLQRNFSKFVLFFALNFRKCNLHKHTYKQLVFFLSFNLFRITGVLNMWVCKKLKLCSACDTHTHKVTPYLKCVKYENRSGKIFSPKHTRKKVIVYTKTTTTNNNKKV